MAMKETISNSLSGFASFNVTDFLYKIVIGIFCLAGLGFAIWFVYMQMQYKYKVIILEEQSDGGTMVHYDKGRIKKRSDGTTFFALQRHKTKLQPPELNAMLITDKGRKVVFMKKYGLGEFDYYPIGLSLRGSQVYINAFLVGRQNWISTELKRSLQKYGSFWDKYGGIIMTGGIMAMTLLMLIIVFKMNQTTAELMNDAMTKVANAISSMGTQTIGNSGGPPPGVP